MSKKISELPQYIGAPQPNGDVPISIGGTTYKINPSLIFAPRTQTLQEILDNNHELVNANNFQGTGAGNGASGTDLNLFGSSAGDGQTGSINNGFGRFALQNSVGSNNNALGRGALSDNNGDNNNAFGNQALLGNSGNNNNAFGSLAGDGNTHNNVNLFGAKADADADNQTVFAKSVAEQWRVSFANITSFRKVEAPNKDGTFAYLDDCDTNAILTKIGNGSIINQSYLPSYVDDVLNFANLASFPATGETGKIYIANDTNKQYRWTGSAYIQITNGFIASTTDVPEGTNLYFTPTRVATKADLASPTFTGTPQAPTPPAGDNSTKIATTAFANANFIKNYFSDATPKTPVTSIATEEYRGTYFIPAGTLLTSQVLKMVFKAVKTGVSGTMTLRVRVGTTSTWSNTLPEIATYISSSANITTQIERVFLINAGELSFIASNNVITDTGVFAVAPTTTSFVVSSDIYLFTSLRNSSVVDSSTQVLFTLTN
jgi:hypothetical protein